jgi:hypothetical protein
MYLMNDSTLPIVVEANFANIESEGHSLEGFKAMLARLKGEPEYCERDFPFDMRCGLREHFTIRGAMGEANTQIQKNHESIKSLISLKIRALKEAGFMDNLSAVMLADFCYTSGSYARSAANGHTVDLFMCCLSNIWHISENENLQDSFIADVIKIELIRDTPLSIIEQSGISQDEILGFAKFTRRADVMKLLDNKGKRELLGDELGL